MARKDNEISVLSQVIASQIDIHKETGGVVPDVAAREHAKVLMPLVKKVLNEADTEIDAIDAIAVTVGPGLMPALAIGTQAARTLAFAANKPIIPIHHIEGHIVSALVKAASSSSNTYEIPDAENQFPALALIISGGHTMLIEITRFGSYQLLGQTRDDAAGEAFDKVARLLDLPYPGGPNLSALAEKGKTDAFPFPRPMAHSGDLDFSFSGLKTAVLYTLRDVPGAVKEDVAASFQAAVVDSLLLKVTQALKKKSYKTLIVAGGVAANTELRNRVQALTDDMNVELHVAPLALCGDNAVMIGQAALVGLPHRQSVSWDAIEPNARIDIETVAY